MKRACCLAMLWLLLSGCEEERDSDLRAWMAEVRLHHHAQPLSAPAVTALPSFQYVPGERIDPFDPGKLAVTDAGSSANSPQPDLRREREPLESFPLDALRLIGSLRRGRDLVALIEADKHVYQIRVGGHLGQDFGTVVAIGEKFIDIEELVPESDGRWMQRRAQLFLQEKK